MDSSKALFMTETNIIELTQQNTHYSVKRPLVLMKDQNEAEEA